MSRTPDVTVGIHICSGAEWRATRAILQITDAEIERYPYGEFVTREMERRRCVFYFSRMTKTRSAGACQYAIDHWGVDQVIVMGTCGGVSEKLKPLDVIQATRTIQYDCNNKIRPDSTAVFDMLAVNLDNTWLELPASANLLRGTVASADHDMTFEDLEPLRRHQVLGADWESGAIAIVCALNRVRCAIFRGVTDVPSAATVDDARLQFEGYRANTPAIMERLLRLLPYVLRGTPRSSR